MSAEEYRNQVFASEALLRLCRRYAPSVMSSTSPLSPKHCANLQPPELDASESMVCMWDDGGVYLSMYF